jgi:hypothetical protein
LCWKLHPYCGQRSCVALTHATRTRVGKFRGPRNAKPDMSTQASPFQIFHAWTLLKSFKAIS